MSSLLRRVARASLTAAAARPAFAAVPRPAAAASVFARSFAAASKPTQGAPAAHAHAQSGHHDEHDHHGPKPDGGQTAEGEHTSRAQTEQRTQSRAEQSRRLMIIACSLWCVRCVCAAEDAESHTYAGLTLIKPKPWQTYGAHFFGQKTQPSGPDEAEAIGASLLIALSVSVCLCVAGGLLWFWIIYRMKNDYKIFFVRRTRSKQSRRSRPRCSALGSSRIHSLCAAASVVVISVCCCVDA